MLSKKQLRRKLAKECDPLEIEKLRLRERTKLPSKVARFLPTITKREQREIAKKYKPEEFKEETIDRTFKDDVP